MASPPKPWERAGGATPVSSTLQPPPAATTTPISTASTSAAIPPTVPDRPASLASAVNQNAAAYSRVGAVGANPYGTYGTAYSSPYASPYSRLGGYGGYGGYGGGMYGGGGYGGYGGGMGGMYGGGMYGGGMGGMPGNPNDPNSLTNRFSQGTATTFQMLEGIVTAFGGFAQMLESTYMATHSSFFAMVSVAEQFGNLRDTLGSILGIFTLMRWLRTLFAKVTGRPPPADAMALTPAAFARFEGRNPGPDGAGPPRASRKPLLFFLVAAFGLPYLMSKTIKSLAASQEEEERKRQAAAGEQALQQQIDPTKLEFCRALYDFTPQAGNAVQGVDLEVRKGDLVAVLSKSDPLGNPSEWWRCRARDGRMGYLPSTYLEVIRKSGQQPVAAIKAAASESSRANSLTNTIASEATPVPTPIPEPLKSKLGDISADSFQRSQFYS